MEEVAPREAACRLSAASGRLWWGTDIVIAGARGEFGGRGAIVRMRCRVRGGCRRVSTTIAGRRRGTSPGLAGRRRGTSSARWLPVRPNHPCLHPKRGVPVEGLGRVGAGCPRGSAWRSSDQRGGVGSSSSRMSGSPPMRHHGGAKQRQQGSFGSRHCVLHASERRGRAAHTPRTSGSTRPTACVSWRWPCGRARRGRVESILV